MDEIEHRMVVQTHILLEALLEELRQIKMLLEKPTIQVICAPPKIEPDILHY